MARITPGESRQMPRDRHQRYPPMDPSSQSSPQHGRQRYTDQRPYQYQRVDGSRSERRQAWVEEGFNERAKRVEIPVPGRAREALPSIQQSFVAASDRYIKPDPDEEDSKQHIKPDPDEQDSKQNIKPDPDAGHESTLSPQTRLKPASVQEPAYPSPAQQASPTSRPWHGPWDPVKEGYIPQPPRVQPPVFFRELKWQEWDSQRYTKSIMDQPRQDEQQSNMLPGLQRGMDLRRALPATFPTTDSQQYPIQSLAEDSIQANNSQPFGKFPNKPNKAQRHGLSRREMKRLNMPQAFRNPNPTGR
ncbi:uncharacterized protein RCC_02045 [Ramularia collo-cygni]|uniref:Uncharacterized protein n=1 Tax=Ramularia collo-cygni TaxID=112498 RepID=A0A2D3V773_9PEZI|nr:uncharacterized protein RCC_02045 [Ramularia collo-cygni]CZT16203.1 uncharacterized protein RCC_02045 [Ramularia collo-cygni]